MATLEVVRAPERMPARISLLKSATVLGRDPSSDIRLQWDGVSRQHARIEADALHYNGTGVPTRFTLVDCGGANGTFVNGSRISKVTLHATRRACARRRSAPSTLPAAHGALMWLVGWGSRRSRSKTGT